MEPGNRIASLISMLEKEPNDLFLNYALGIEYTSDPKTFPDAESQFKIVLNLNNDYVPAYYQLGKLSESLLRNPEAIEYYKKGLDKAIAQKNNKAINEFKEAIFLLED